MMPIPPADKLLNDTERRIFEAVWAAGWRACDDYHLAVASNSSGLRGDGEPYEKPVKPRNPYAPPP